MEEVLALLGSTNQGHVMENLSVKIKIIVGHFEKMSNMTEKREKKIETKIER